MSGSVSLAPTDDRHDADRPAPLRRTVTGQDLAYLIRTLLRFLAQRERPLVLAWPTCVVHLKSLDSRRCPDGVADCGRQNGFSDHFPISGTAR
jgi:hypothetical protein